MTPNNLTKKLNKITKIYIRNFSQSERFIRFITRLIRVTQSIERLSLGENISK